MALVTPRQGQAVAIVTGGTAVLVFPAGINGGFIFNPASDTDQGVLIENLYVNPIGSFSTLQANGTTFLLVPGQTWVAIPLQNTPTYVNATTTGHKFTAVYW